MKTILPLLPLLAAPQGAAVSVDEPLLRAVPEDALFVASIPRVAELRGRAAENAWVKLARDPVLEPVWSGLFLGWTPPAMNEPHGPEAAAEGGEMSLAGLARLDRVLAELDALCVFVVPAEPEFEGGFMLAVGPERAAVDRWLDHLFPGRGVVDRAAQDGLEIELRSPNRRGTDTHLAHLELPGLSAWLWGATPERALEGARAVAARWNGAPASGSILASERFAEARRDAGGKPAVELYADLGAIVQRAIEEDPPDESGAKILQAINLQGLSWARGSFDIGAGERFDFELAAKLPDKGLLRTWADFLGPAPKAFARWIPRDVSSVGLGRFDLYGIYRSVMEKLEESAPEQHQEMRAGIEMASQSTGVDIEADILGQLTGDFASFELARPEAGDGEHSTLTLGLTGMMLPGGMMGGPNPFATTAYVVGLKDPGIVEQALSDLLATAEVEDQVEVAVHRDVEVSSITVEGDFGPRWAFLDDHVLVAFSDVPIDAALGMHAETPPPSVLENPLLGPALQASTGEACVSVADTRALVRTMIQLFTADHAIATEEFEASAEVETEGEEDGQDVQVVDVATSEPPDASTPPDFAALARHFRGMVGSTFGARGGVLRLRYYGR